MRPYRLLIPLALLVPLAPASPAAAVDFPVRVTDYEFGPKEVKVGVGDSVTWSFDMGSHTTTSDSGQVESWDSGPAASPVGTKYTQTFNTPGRFSYYCIPHQAFMKGAVVVGTDEFKKSQTKFKQVRRGSKVTFSFKLVEAAKVVASIKGPNKKKATRKRLKPGRYSIALRGLKQGRYKGTVTFTDDFDKVSKVRVSVRVP
ncbi:MAG TPA: plastocyanin/azurin family copper-binding protein [Thermoleophilaceae bacterium]|jgi:plastocyanin|nr:plastocyanin/azurin family copper-binding protein [Thermoleophilaceae bacterium]